MDATDTAWTLRSSTSDDASWMAELRAVVMRPDLERLGRFDEVRVRRWFLGAFEPAQTQVVVVDGADVGLVALRPEPESEAGTLWLEHFHLDPRVQGRGLGGAVLTRLLAGAAAGRPVRLNVLAGSRAVRLYARHGFHTYASDPVDVWMERDPA